MGWFWVPSALRGALEFQAAPSDTPCTPTLQFHPKSHCEKLIFKGYYHWYSLQEPFIFHNSRVDIWGSFFNPEKQASHMGGNITKLGSLFRKETENFQLNAQMKLWRLEIDSWTYCFAFDLDERKEISVLSLTQNEVEGSYAFWFLIL